VSHGRRKESRKGQVLVWFRSPFPALIAALALVVQLFAVPFHHPIAPYGGARAATIELEALFGDNVVVCSQADDSSGPSAAGRAHCADVCPLCRFAGAAAALTGPPLEFALVAPTRASVAVVAGAERVDRKPQLHAFAQARAPPLAV